MLAVEELFSDTDDCQPSKKSLDPSIGHQDFPCDDSMLWNSMESHPEKRYLWDLLPDELNYLQHTCDRQVYLKCGFHSKRCVKLFSRKGYSEIVKRKLFGDTVLSTMFQSNKNEIFDLL